MDVWVVEIQDEDRREVLELLRESSDPALGRGARVRFVSPEGCVIEEGVRGAVNRRSTAPRFTAARYLNPLEFYKEWGHIPHYEEVLGASRRFRDSRDSIRHFQDYGDIPHYEDLIRERV